MKVGPIPLMSVSPDFEILLLTLDTQAAENATLGWAEAGLSVRTVRGKKMRTVPQLFDEVSAALQFPYYFGENWNAFDECLSEIDWFPFGNGFVIVIRDAECVLADEPNAEIRTLVRLFTTAHETYSVAVEEGGSWDRPPVPFHVVLLGANDERRKAAEGRWKAAGAVTIPFP